MEQMVHALQEFVWGPGIFSGNRNPFYSTVRLLPIYEDPSLDGQYHRRFKKEPQDKKNSG